MRKIIIKWGPVLGTVCLILIEGFKAMGLDSWANVVATIGGLSGVIAQTDVPITEIAMLVGSLAGVGLRIYNQIKKARARK
jgi:hypothetical protein